MRFVSSTSCNITNICHLTDTATDSDSDSCPCLTWRQLIHHKLHRMSTRSKWKRQHVISSEYMIILHIVNLTAVLSFCSAIKELLEEEVIYRPNSEKLKKHLCSADGVCHSVKVRLIERTPSFLDQMNTTQFFNRNGQHWITLQGVVDGRGLLWNAWRQSDIMLVVGSSYSLIKCCGLLYSQWHWKASLSNPSQTITGQKLVYSHKSTEPGGRCVCQADWRTDGGASWNCIMHEIHGDSVLCCAESLWNS